MSVLPLTLNMVCKWCPNISCFGFPFELCSSLEKGQPYIFRVGSGQVRHPVKLDTHSQFDHGFLGGGFSIIYKWKKKMHHFRFSTYGISLNFLVSYRTNIIFAFVVKISVSNICKLRVPWTGDQRSRWRDPQHESWRETPHLHSRTCEYIHTNNFFLLQACWNKSL